MTTTHDISADFVVITREPWVDGKSKERMATIGHLDLFCSKIDRAQVVPAGRMAEFTGPSWPCDACAQGSDNYSAEPTTVLAKVQGPVVERPKQGIEVDPDDAEWAAAEVEGWLGRHDSKVEVGEVTEGLRLAATTWAKAWDGDFEFMVDMHKAAGQARGLSRGQAKGVLNCWRADLNRRPAIKAPALTETGIPGQDGTPPLAKPAKVETEIEDGFYVAVSQDEADEPRIWKVQVAVHGSGNLYAKVLRRGEDGGRGSWEYVQGAVGTVRRGVADGSVVRLTLDLAKNLGHLYGMCCCCGATLTDERSIEAGIGPICAGKLG